MLSLNDLENMELLGVVLDEIRKDVPGLPMGTLLVSCIQAFSSHKKW